MKGGSQMNLHNHFPQIWQFACDPNSGRTGHTEILFGCRKWVRDARKLSGTQYTIRNWENLYHRGLKLSSRLVILQNHWQLLWQKPVDTK